MLPLPDGATLPVVRALDNVVGCHPAARLLVVEVPEVSAPIALHLENGRVEVGPVPAEGREFVARDVVAVRGLRLTWMEIGVRVSLRARVWSIGKSQG